ncbi:MAG: hypothetical protein K8L91_31875 [Anaerolineae bacterium]|nr:MAG: hypothetical protein F9K46_05035 [Anaerolineae bacterium]MBZ0321058.1 hypothetical protein [Anaerolineae bacterium]
MFNPCNETITLLNPIEVVFEVISEDGIQDQYLAWFDRPFGFLTAVLGSSHSEVEIEAARRLILDKDWQVKYSQFYTEAYAYVQDGKEAWIRLFKSDLRSESLQMVGLQETALASLFTGLIDQLADATAEANEREDRAYPARSAGRFAKAS